MLVTVLYVGRGERGIRLAGYLLSRYLKVPPPQQFHVFCRIFFIYKWINWFAIFSVTSFDYKRKENTKRENIFPSSMKRTLVKHTNALGVLDPFVYVRRRHTSVASGLNVYRSTSIKHVPLSYPRIFPISISWRRTTATGNNDRNRSCHAGVRL